jgi:acetyl-CoA carboxylase biotin carboxyl carrier protein
MKDGDFEITIRTDKYHQKIKSKGDIISAPAMHLREPAYHAPVLSEQVVQVPAHSPDETASVTSDPAAAAEDTNKGLLEIRSPIVGTFYRAASPEKPPYVKVGDVINQGDVVCIVEAMKLFNEIESELSGKVVKTLVEDGTPVEYDQILFLLDPQG